VIIARAFQTYYGDYQVIMEYFMCEDSTVVIATGYGLDNKELEFESWWGQEFSLLHVQTSSGVLSVSYPMGTRSKAAGA
jgi:hypothetical protein